MRPRRSNRRSNLSSNGSVGSFGSLDPLLLSDLEDGSDTNENQQEIAEIFEASMNITGDSSYSGRRLQSFRDNRAHREHRRHRTNRKNPTNDTSASSASGADRLSLAASESASSYEDMDVESLQQILNDSLSVTGDASYSGRRIQTFQARKEERMRTESADRAGGRSASSHERLRDPNDRRLAFHNSRRGSRRSFRIQELEQIHAERGESTERPEEPDKMSTTRRTSDSGIDRPHSNTFSGRAA